MLQEYPRVMRYDRSLYGSRIFRANKNPMPQKRDMGHPVVMDWRGYFFFLAFFGLSSVSWSPTICRRMKLVAPERVRVPATMPST
jgi:hypothetical protein